MNNVPIIALLLCLAAAAQARGPARASEANTRGWQLMTPEERIEHQSRIRGFRTYEECRNYQVAHHQLMEERARARGMALPQGGRDICEHLQPASDSRLAWQTLSPFSQGWPVRLGWLSLLLLMLGLAATFATHLPYRSWRWLHVSLGVGVLVGLWHLLQLGIDEPVLPILTLAALFLGWRLLREDSGLAARPYLVQAAAPVADGTVEITLKPLAEPIAATAGQFVLVAFFAGPTFRGCGEFHPFTVSSMGADREIRVGVKALGDCTRRIQSIEPGVLARVHGGFGTFLAERPAAPQLWLAGGIGITPFLALLRTGPVSQETTLVYLYRAETDAAFLQELRELAERDPQLSLQALATGNEPPDVNALLPDAVKLAGVECYLCGPPGLLTTVRQSLHARGIKPWHVHFENFGFR